MKTNITYELLKAYAASRYTFTPAGTIRQFTEWYEHFAGIRVPERTFQRHTRQLQDAGLIAVKHTKYRTHYTLLDFEFKMPKMEFVPTSAPGQFVINENGAKSVRLPEADNEPGWFNHNLDPTDGGPEHRAAMESLRDFALPF